MTNRKPKKATAAPLPSVLPPTGRRAQAHGAQPNSDQQQHETFGCNIPEFEAALEALQRIGRERTRFMLFTVGDENAAPILRSGSLAVLDSTSLAREGFVDGALYVFDLQPENPPVSRRGEPLRMYPSVFRVARMLMGELRLLRENGETADMISHDQAMAACKGRVVASFNIHAPREFR